MKCSVDFPSIITAKSPSMRREWIEMKCCIINIEKITKSPSMRREWIEMQWNLNTNKDVWRLPPCGGSGLKSLDGLAESINETVSLHAEGVD